MKSKLYLFFTPKNLSYLYLYGAQVNFNGGILHYQNNNMSPGQAIITWKNGERVMGFTPSIFLPELKVKQKYQFQFAAKTEPENSIGLALTTFDQKGEQLNYEILSGLSGNFITNEMDSYQLALVSLENKLLEFTDLVLGCYPVLSEHTVKVNLVSDIICLLVQKDKVLKNTRLRVHVEVQDQTIIPVSFTSDENHLFLFVAVSFTGENGFSRQQLIAIASYLDKLRLHHITLELDDSMLSKALIAVLKDYLV